MKKELQRLWKEADIQKRSYSPDIHLEKLMKTTEILSHGIRSPDRHLESRPLKQESSGVIDFPVMYGKCFLARCTKPAS